MQYAQVPAIVLFCYGCAELLKKTKLNTKYLPTICGVLGLILGIAAFFLVETYEADIFTAAISGLASGLAATGSNQVFKQLVTQAKIEETTDDEENLVDEDDKADS